MHAYLKFQLKVMIQLVLQYKAQSRQLEINSSGIKPKVRSWNGKKKKKGTNYYSSNISPTFL